MSNVREIKPLRVKSNKDIEEALLDALRRCRKDKFSGVGIVLESPDEVYFNWVSAKTGRMNGLIGAVERLKHEMMAYWVSYD